MNRINLKVLIILWLFNRSVFKHSINHLEHSMIVNINILTQHLTIKTMFKWKNIYSLSNHYSDLELQSSMSNLKILISFSNRLSFKDLMFEFLLIKKLDNTDQSNLTEIEKRWLSFKRRIGKVESIRYLQHLQHQHSLQHKNSVEGTEVSKNQHKLLDLLSE